MDLKKFRGLFIITLTISVILATSTPAYAEDEPPLTDEELSILFTISIIVVIGIFVYLARDIILRRKTDYEKGKFQSQKNKDYEKYHSNWTDDTVEFGKQESYTEEDEEYQKKARDPNHTNYYEILGVPKDATSDEIKIRFRELAKQWHPDKRTEKDDAKMSEINKAYEVLSDSEKRKKYDKYLNVS